MRGWKGNPHAHYYFAKGFTLTPSLSKLIHMVAKATDKKAREKQKEQQPVPLKKAA